jgi:hypothetical protein
VFSSAITSSPSLGELLDCRSCCFLSNLSKGCHLLFSSGVFSRLNGRVYQSHGVAEQRARKAGLPCSPVEIGNAERVCAAHHGQAHLAKPSGDVLEKRLTFGVTTAGNCEQCQRLVSVSQLMVIVQLLQQGPTLPKGLGSLLSLRAQEVKVTECEQVFSLASTISQLDGKFVACGIQDLRAIQIQIVERLIAAKVEDMGPSPPVRPRLEKR